MALGYLRKASKIAEPNDETARRIVAQMLAKMRTGGEAVMRACAARLDGWEDDIVISENSLHAAGSVPLKRWFGWP